MTAVLRNDLPVIAPHWKLSTGDYHHMIAAGILPEDARIELIKGELIDMGAIGFFHASVSNQITMDLCHLTQGRAMVWCQGPIYLGPHSEPQPDLTLLRPHPQRYRTRAPHIDDVLLVIEIADASLRYDRDIKIPLYALAGLPEYWIVNLTDRTIETHRDPDKTLGRYLTVTEASGGTLSPLALPDLAVDITDWLN
jgi:Uma2 family endonuclease